MNRVVNSLLIEEKRRLTHAGTDVKCNLSGQE